MKLTIGDVLLAGGAGAVLYLVWSRARASVMTTGSEGARSSPRSAAPTFKSAPTYAPRGGEVTEDYEQGTTNVEEETLSDRLWNWVDGESDESNESDQYFS